MSLIVYFSSEDNRILSFNKYDDIIATKEYYQEKTIKYIEGKTTFKYYPFRDFEIIYKGNIKDITLTLRLFFNENNPLDISLYETPIGSTIFKIHQKEYHDKLYDIEISNGYNSKKLNIYHLFGKVKVQILVNNNIYEDNGKKYETYLSLTPTFTHWNDIKKLLNDFSKRQQVIYDYDCTLTRDIEFDDSLSSSFELGLLILKKLYSEMEIVLEMFQYHYRLSRVSISKDCNQINKSTQKIRRPNSIQFVIGNTKKIPLKLVDQQYTKSYDIYENYIVKKAIDLFCMINKIQIEKIRNNINQIPISKNKHKVTDRNPEKIETLGRMKNEHETLLSKCNMIKNKSPLTNLSPLRNITKTRSNLLLYNPKYRAIYNILKKLCGIPRLTIYSIENLSDNVKQLNDLYEEWLFLLLRESFVNLNFELVQDLLIEEYTGQVVQVGEKDEATAIFYSPNKKYCIKIFREKIYQKGSKDKSGYGVLDPYQNEEEYWNEIIVHIEKDPYNNKPRNIMRSKRCPDVSIEIFPINNYQNVPLDIITLDCHFSDRPDIKKFMYRDNIVIFNQKVKDQNNILKPKRIVSAAIDVYWGKSDKLIDNYNPIYECCYSLPVNYQCSKNIEGLFSKRLLRNNLKYLIE